MVRDFFKCHIGIVDQVFDRLSVVVAGEEDADRGMELGGRHRLCYEISPGKKDDAEKKHGYGYEEIQRFPEFRLL